MNMPVSEIENHLRNAPAPKAPGGLKERLAAQVRLPLKNRQAAATGPLRDSRGWLRRWWPALAPTAVSLASAVVFTVQQMEIRDLKQNIAALPQIPEAARSIDSANATMTQKGAPNSGLDEQGEIDRLKEEAGRLAAEIAQLEKTRAENEKLQAQLAAPAANALTAEEEEALVRAQERAASIRCVNNLKQFGLAVRTWALDNGDITPPDVLSMSNELSTPLVLFCPADTNRPSVKSWSSFTAANCSYEYLASSTPDGKEPARVLSQCPIHGHVGLLDGSVQMSVAKTHPEWLVQRDGKTYLENQNASPTPATETPKP